MKTCPICSRLFDDTLDACLYDGAPLRAGDPLIGTLVDGKYRITDRLGEGSFGSVYLALQVQLDRRVVVKVLRGEKANQEKVRTLFRRAALAVARLQHPNIVTLFDFGVAEHLGAYHVLEYCEGHGLRERLDREGRLEVESAVEFASQVCSALTAVHHAGLVHRDVKPENVILVTTPQGLTAKLVDFLVVHFAASASDEDPLSGKTVGTPNYMSPEQCRGAVADARSDIYSLGCMLYEMVTGRLPFTYSALSENDVASKVEDDGADIRPLDQPWVIELLRQHCETAPTPPSVHNPDVPPALEQVILRALAKDVDDRFHTAAELQQALRAVCGERITLPYVPPITDAATLMMDATEGGNLRADLLAGRYVITRQLGRGGMGAVFEAVDERFGRRVAVKETLFTDDRMRRAFGHEARLLNSLRHRALPVVTDFFGEGDRQFLVMDYVEGRDLGEELVARRRAFPVDEVLAIADQLLEALEYLHRHEPPVVHRDIKPQNVKRTPRGDVMLLDFGLSKGSAADMAQTHGATSVRAYTPHYAPPEQIQGSRTDARSDLYSVGATLHTLLTGAVPADALARMAAAFENLPDPLVRADEAEPSVPRGLADIIQSAMALRSGERPQSASELRSTLRAIRLLDQ